MKLNFNIDLDYDDNISSLENDIIEESARQLICEVLGNRYGHYGKTFEEKLQEKIKEILLNTMNTDFKEEIKKGLIEDLGKKYIRTKQYKEIKEKFDINSDSTIRSGLSDIIAELVDKELKKDLNEKIFY